MATLEELKARLSDAINAYKNQNARFEPLKNFEEAAKIFQKAKDQTTAKENLRIAFVALQNAGITFGGTLKMVFQQCQSMFDMTLKKEITATKIIICRHIISYAGMNCQSYTQMKIVPGQTDYAGEHRIHIKPPFNVSRYKWQQRTKNWVPEFEQGLLATETINAFTNQDEIALYANFRATLQAKGALEKYIKEYGKKGGDKHPIMTANSVLWRVLSAPSATLTLLFTLNRQDLNDNFVFRATSQSAQTLNLNLDRIYDFFTETHSMCANLDISIPILTLQGDPIQSNTIINNIQNAIIRRLASAHCVVSGLVPLPVFNFTTSTDATNANNIGVMLF